MKSKCKYSRFSGGAQYSHRSYIFTILYLCLITIVIRIMVRTKEDSVLTISLVEAVENYSCFYNYNVPEYVRKNIMEKAWSKVAQEVKEAGNNINYYLISIQC